MNWLRYWFPALGGRRQCVKCGFLSDEDNIIEGSSIAPRLTPQHKEVELSIREGISFDAIGLPPISTAACFRGIWGPVGDSMEGLLKDEVLQKRRCRYFFPHQVGTPPPIHLDIMRQVSNRWWTFWAVLGATGIGGSVSGVVVWLLQRGNTP